MSNEAPLQPLGDVIRDARVAKGLKLRELARQLGIAPSYLSDIENNHRTPSEDLLKHLAQILSLEFNQLMALAGRVGESAERYVRHRPTAGALFRKISERGLSEEALQQLMEEVDRLESGGSQE